MEKAGVHIIDPDNLLTLEKVKKICRLNKDIDKIANKYIENYNRCSVLFSNVDQKTPEEIKAIAYRHAELDLASAQILRQGNSCWSIFNLEEKDIFRKAEGVSKKLALNYKCPGMRVFAITGDHAIFVAQGFIDGILFFDFQAGYYWDNIGYLPLSTQQEYFNRFRHLEKSDPRLVQDFFQPDRLDLMEKICNERDSKRLVELFEAMLSMHLFYDFSI